MTPCASACAAALTRLPGMGPARLLAMIRDRDPRDVWDDVVHGRISKKVFAQPNLLGDSPACSDRSWASAASRFDPEAWWSKARSRGVDVSWIGRDGYPAVLADDPHPPGVIFWRGSLASLDRPRVAIVGTRSASPDGRAVAYEMGRDLASAGVCVVSGLALGIDGSAHRGALSALGEAARDPASVAATIGVAASGVDVPYPRRHAALWEEVAASGAVISETPPGYAAQAWRFPARNRIIAGLSQLVVVVESHEAGGSLITAEAAIERGIEVRVVPGPVGSSACAGSNQLLYDGAGPVRGPRDVLDALGMLMPDPPKPGQAKGRRRSRRSPDGTRISLGPTEQAVLASVGWVPSSLNKVAERSALPVAQVAGALDGLSARGLVADDRGWWTRLR
ncbi:MAG TPA: DNA-processing protein DprA [Acidimicrobiales bacterium]|nr:DNA-processing protein DprA [Acidimicrobiales bacterium]